MTRWDALVAISRDLRAGLLDGERAPERDVPWELVIEVASFHYVTPALAACLAHADVPADVRDYFASVAALNGQRNAGMLAGLTRAAGLLNAIGIEPLLLKGASLLADGTYAEPSQRLLGDVDVLIPESRAAEAAAALSAAGFAAKPSDTVPPPGHHHLPMLHDPETGVGIELHTDVVSRSPDAAIATAWFWQHARPALFRDARVLLPEPTRNGGHVIFHSQLFHGLDRLNKIQLRHLLDLALIRARHGGAIDWGELDRRFSAAGFGEVLATYLAFAEELFGQPAPALSHAPRKDAMAELRETEGRDSFHAQIERLQTYQGALQTELSHMTAARDRAQSEAEQLRAAQAALTAERNDIAATRDRVQSEAEQLRAAHAASTAEHNRAAAAHAEATRVFAATADALAVTERARKVLEGEFAAVQRARDELQRDLVGIQASRAWRWTAPLRAVMAALRRSR